MTGYNRVREKGYERNIVGVTQNNSEIQITVISLEPATKMVIQ